MRGDPSAPTPWIWILEFLCSLSGFTLTIPGKCNGSRIIGPITSVASQSQMVGSMTSLSANKTYSISGWATDHISVHFSIVFPLLGVIRSLSNLLIIMSGTQMPSFLRIVWWYRFCRNFTGWIGFLEGIPYAKIPQQKSPHPIRTRLSAGI